MTQPQKQESKIERAIRYSKKLMEVQGSSYAELSEYVRSFRPKNDIRRSDTSCLNIIERAIHQAAESSLYVGTDFEDVDSLCKSVRTKIKEHFDKNRDNGYSLGE